MSRNATPRTLPRNANYEPWERASWGRGRWRLGKVTQGLRTGTHGNLRLAIVDGDPMGPCFHALATRAILTKYFQGARKVTRWAW